MNAKDKELQMARLDAKTAWAVVEGNEVALKAYEIETGGLRAECAQRRVNGEKYRKDTQAAYKKIGALKGQLATEKAVRAVAMDTLGKLREQNSQLKQHLEQ